MMFTVKVRNISDAISSNSELRQPVRSCDLAGGTVVKSENYSR